MVKNFHCFRWSVATKELENFSMKTRMDSGLLRYILAYGHEKSPVRTLEAMHVSLRQVVDRCHSKLGPHETTAHNEQNDMNMSSGSSLLSFETTLAWKVRQTIYANFHRDAD